MARTIDIEKVVTPPDIADFCHMMYGWDGVDVDVNGTDVTINTVMSDGQWGDFATFFIKTAAERDAETAAAQALDDKPITDALTPTATTATIKLALAELARRVGVEVK